MTDVLVSLLDFTASKLLPLKKARTRHVLTKLCKFGQNTSPNNVRIKDRTDLNPRLLSRGLCRLLLFSSGETINRSKTFAFVNMTAERHQLVSHHCV